MQPRSILEAKHSLSPGPASLARAPSASGSPSRRLGNLNTTIGWLGLPCKASQSF